MFFPIQASFQGGEISPRMYGRTDLPWYKHGVAYSENWLHLPQGGIRMRAGTKYLVDASHEDSGPVPVRLIPFNLAEGEDYCLELGPGYVRVLSTDGVVDVVGPENVVNGGFSGIAPWVTGTNGPGVIYGCDWSPSGGGWLDMTTYDNTPTYFGPPHPHVYYPPAPAQPWIEQTIPGLAAATYVLKYSTSGDAIDVSVYDIGASAFVYTATSPAGVVTDTVASIVVTGTAGVIIKFTSHAPPGTYSISCAMANVSFRNTAGGGPAVITGRPWTAAMLPTIQWAQDVTSGMFLTHPLMKPQVIQYDALTGVFTAADIVLAPASVGTVQHTGTGLSVLTATAIGGGPNASANVIVTVALGAANPAGKPWITISLDGGATQLNAPGGTASSQNAFQLSDDGSGHAVLIIPAATNSDGMTVQNIGVQLSFDNNTFVTGDVYQFLVTGPPPAEWSSTGYNAGPNWPACVEIWQQRLWFADTPKNPASFWGSRTFGFLDFTQDAILSDSSPFTLALGTKGGIKWIAGKQALLIGTDLHEDIVTANNLAVSAMDAQLLRQSAYGSGDFQAINIGDQVIYISRDNTKLRTLNFNFDTQAWISHDLAFYAQHITLPGLLTCTFARDPDNTIYSVMVDGSMRMTTYDRLSETLAWSRMTTQGKVISATTTVDPTGATTWLAVVRNGQTMIEILPAYDPNVNQFLDCYQKLTPVVTTAPGPVYTITISGISDEFNGIPTGVIVDGAWYGTYVPSGGVVSFPFNNPTATQAVVGLLYRAVLTSLPLAEGVMYGTAQGQMKRRHRVYARLTTSTFPLINGKRPSAQRSPSTPMGVVEPETTFQDVFVTQLGWDRTAQFSLEQDLPFETEIQAVFGGSDVSQAV